jgi:hypothetical protein
MPLPAYRRRRKAVFEAKRAAGERRYKHWWIKLRPRAKGKVARRIKRQLRRRGRARVNLRIFCAEDGNPTLAYAKKRIVLRKKKVRRRAKVRRGATGLRIAPRRALKPQASKR